MVLLLGLGNIGVHFEGTRHNTGFRILDSFAASHGLEWQTKDRFKAIVAEGIILNQKVILAKPTTYYNLSGEAARAIKDFYKIGNQDILVVHDELALPFGTIRTRTTGSDAGNNGIKNIIAHVGEDVARIRIGIANNIAEEAIATDFVLGRFTQEERAVWPKIQQEVNRLIASFIAKDKKYEHTSIRTI